MRILYKGARVPIDRHDTIRDFELPHKEALTQFGDGKSDDRDIAQLLCKDKLG